MTYVRRMYEWVLESKAKLSMAGVLGLGMVVGHYVPGMVNKAMPRAEAGNRGEVWIRATGRDEIPWKEWTKFTLGGYEFKDERITHICSGDINGDNMDDIIISTTVLDRQGEPTGTDRLRFLYSTCPPPSRR